MQLSAFTDRFPVYDASRLPLADFLRDDAAAVLTERGALLIRNTGIGSTTELERYAALWISEPAQSYTGGVIPRTAQSRYVFNSTEVPRLHKLKLHSEMAYQTNFPRYISFFCATAPTVGGATPVAHNEDFQHHLPAALRETIMADDVVYVRRYPCAKRGAAKLARFPRMFVPWQDAFGTDDEHQVEAVCRELGAQFDWGRDATLTLRTVLPAARTHPDTGRRVYFNQLLTQNFSAAGQGAVEVLAYRVAGARRDSRPKDSYLAGYGRLTRRDRSALLSACAKSARTFAWRRGDWLLCDNLQVLHGRNRFLGRREIWVVMGD